LQFDLPQLAAGSNEMIPIRDENPSIRTPVVTIVLIALTTLAWLAVQGAGTFDALLGSVCELGLIPGELTGQAAGRLEQLGPGALCQVGESARWYTLFTSMFLHGGWLHLIGNMWFLWVFGNNVEDAMGRLRFALFYLITGLAAAGAQILTDPGSPIPMVGASGAVSGVMGAYVVLYARVPVRVLVFLGFFITMIRMPAFLMLGYWFLLQLIGGLPAINADGAAGGIAFWAHVGGFLAGALLVFPFRNPKLVEAHRRHRDEWLAR
jgi:membrane associated rhomboid family serine protease